LASNDTESFVEIDVSITRFVTVPPGPLALAAVIIPADVW
jgi:hypothetical protein